MVGKLLIVSSVGAMVGKRLIKSSIGANVGKRLIESVVGPILGLFDTGVCVGETIKLVGASVGVCVAPLVGACELFVGVLVGLFVGAVEGLSVGINVDTSRVGSTEEEAGVGELVVGKLVSKSIEVPLRVGTTVDCSTI
jgi:hypothetical protein